MAGISKIAELEARKRALVTQSEICRETLKADVQELLLYGTSITKRIDKFRSVGPWFLLAMPLGASLLGLITRKSHQNHAQPRSKFKAAIAAGLMGMRLYRSYAPTLRDLVSHFTTRRRARKRSFGATI
jgi:hypothetical protein